MKHLKLFESFLNFDFDERLWIELDIDTWHNNFTSSLKNKEEIKPKEAKEITSLMKTKVVFSKKEYPMYLSYRLGNKDGFIYLDIETKNKNDIKIYKFKYDWWGIKVYPPSSSKYGSSLYFICDQKEGLFNWISDWKNKL